MLLWGGEVRIQSMHDIFGPSLPPCGTAFLLSHEIFQGFQFLYECIAIAEWEDVNILQMLLRGHVVCQFTFSGLFLNNVVKIVVQH